jgi:hypothetical protein
METDYSTQRVEDDLDSSDTGSSKPGTLADKFNSADRATSEDTPVMQDMEHVGDQTFNYKHTAGGSPTLSPPSRKEIKRKRSLSASQKGGVQGGSISTSGTVARPFKLPKKDEEDKDVVEAGFAMTLTAEDVEELSAVTVLGRDSSAQGSQTTKKGWFTGIFSGAPKKENIELNSLGDVLLTIERPVKAEADGKEAASIVEIKCASPELQRAATGSTWKTLLNSGSKIRVPCTDDEFGLLFMLRVAHGRDLSKVYDSEFTFEQILGITSIVHKYDASTTVRQELVARIPVTWKEPEYFVNRPEGAQWLFVSWIFGFHDTFRNLLRVLIRQTHIDEKGELVDMNGKLFTGTFPTVVLGHIRQTRIKYLERLIKTTYDYAEKLCDPEQPTCTGASSTHDEENCASVMTGSFLNGLGKIGFTLKLPAVEMIEYSIDEIERKFKAIKGHQPNMHENHRYGKWEDDGGELIPYCQNKDVWYHRLNRALEGVDRTPAQFEQWLRMRRL